ncbi:hypothetical protein MRX96_049499 [Rhipicephalus microplus]
MFPPTRWQKRPRDQTKSPSEGKVKDTPSSAGGSHQLQLCHHLMRVLAWSWMSPLMISKVNCCVLLWKKSASTKMQPHHVLPYPRRNFHLCYTVL